MKNQYVIGIDQSTQGTKALLFDQNGALLHRADRSHEQFVDQRGWVEHDPEEIYRNTIAAVKELMELSGVDRHQVVCVGISNQRETAMAWILEQVDEAKESAGKDELCCGTMDSWLVYRLTGKEEFRTDYSNASRTQLFNITELKWDETLCSYFGIPNSSLPTVTDSDGIYGHTDFDGLLPASVPIHGVLGDSHGALFGQGCLTCGMMKTTYGTGSSIMMNIGEQPIVTDCGLVTSLAWKTQGRVQYVLEGNINYTGAVISWMKDRLGLIEHAEDSEALANVANPADRTYLVPAFSGLGAPYWRSDVSAAFVGMSRTTGKAELVRAGLSSIAYQIADVVDLMKQAAGLKSVEVRADGGPTKNQWLMQFQSDVTGSRVEVSEVEELSGLGAAYAAGIGVGIYQPSLLGEIRRRGFSPQMDEKERNENNQGWNDAVAMVLGGNDDVKGQKHMDRS